MRKADFVIGLIVALAVSYAVNQLRNPEPEEYVSSENGYTLKASSIPTAIEEDVITLRISITGPQDTTLKTVLRHSKLHQSEATLLRRYSTVPLSESDTAKDLYYVSIRTNPKGKRTLYYFELRDPVGRRLASLMKSDKEPFAIMPVADVPKYIVWGYLISLFAAIFAVILGALASIRLIKGHAGTLTFKRTFAAGALLMFVSAGLLGTFHRMYQIGGSWQGVPFGSDFSDNSLLLLIVLLIILSLGAITITTKSGDRKTIFPQKMLGYVGLSSFALMLAALLLPPMFYVDSGIIETFTYASATIMIAACLISFARTRNA